MSKLNCWEVKKCGRQRGGAKEHELGICPASEHTEFSGVNNGVNGGRVCWAVAGTFCGGKKQGMYSEKLVSCMLCEFFKTVKGEEDPKTYQLIPKALQVAKK